MRLVLIAVLAALAAPALAEDIDALETEDGRYVLVERGADVVRLDTRTGSVSVCREKQTGWACALAADERDALEAESDRLADRMERLEVELRRIDERLGAAPPPPAPAKPDKNDAEVERALDLAEKMFRRFFGLVRELRRENEMDRT